MCRVTTALLCVFLLLGAAYAQTDRGIITGTISDSTGAMIPNATIEAKNRQTGALFQAASSLTGNYTLAQLPAGVYELSTSVSGFKKYVRTGITVNVAQTLRIDIPLEVGSISETVTVNADAPLLRTESGELSHIVTSDQMGDLPLLSGAGGIRDSFASVKLLPGAGEVGGGAGAGTLRVNGMQGGTMTLLIEGQDATNGIFTTNYDWAQPGVDSAEQTAILTSNYAAEFGQAGGGIFNMTMRSGTNQFHGSAFEYFRNEALNAAQPFNHFLPVDKRHDYGFTVGGPVWLPHVYDGRDKTFFFWSFEQNRQNLKRSVVDTFPNQAYRGGDFSDPTLWTKKVLGTDVLERPILDGTIYDPQTIRDVVVDGDTYSVRDPFPGNIIPKNRFDPVAEAIQAKIPEPNIAGSGTLNNYQDIFSAAPLVSIYSLKADHQVSPKLKISGFWTYNTSSSFQPNDGLPPEITARVDHAMKTHTVRLNLDYTLSPTMLLHFGAGLFDMRVTTVPGGYGINNLTAFGLPGTPVDFPLSLYGLSQSRGGGYSNRSSAGPGSPSMGTSGMMDQYQLKPTGVANFTWVRGNHTYKFGGELRVESMPSYTGTPANGWFTFSPAETALPYLETTNYNRGILGFPYASFLLGQVSSGQIGVPSAFHLGKHSLAFFFQDSWKVTRKLTVDYGLRYDYQTYLKTDGRVPSFGYDTPNPRYGDIPGAVIFEGYGPGQINGDFASNYLYNFGPRLGVAYQITPKTVIRSGIGVMYGQTANLEMWTLRLGSNEYFGPSTTFGTPISQLKDGPPIEPIWPNTDPGQAPIFPGANFMTSIDRHAGYPPRQVQWSIGIQRELTTNLSLDIAYVGNRGVWWSSSGTLTDPNRVTPAILAAHNLSLANSYDQSLLLKPFSSVSGADAAKYELTAPFAGFAGTVSQSLRPYPHFGSIHVLWAPLGNTWYDAMQVKLTKRFSHGLDLMANYSYQKELTIGQDSFNPSFAPSHPAVNDINDLRSNKVISGVSLPHSLTIAASYTTPKINLYRPLSWLTKDWQLSAFLTYQSGLPIMAPTASNYPNPAQELSLCAPMGIMGGCNTSPYTKANASYENRVPGQPLFTADINSKFDPFTTFVLNPDAWEAPPPGQFGTGSGFYNDYRNMRRPRENLSLGRIFRIREGISLSIRAELDNAFNRVSRGGISTSPVAPQVWKPDGTTASGFGYVNAINSGGQRTGQIIMRLRF